MDFVRSHMTAGQVYSHWGAVSQDSPMDPATVEDILAQRSVFYDELYRPQPGKNGASIQPPISHASAQADDDGRVVAAQARPAIEGARVSREVLEGEDRQQSAGAARLETGGGDEVRAAVDAVATAGDAVRHAMRPEGTQTAEARAADRRYNISVLAAAGLAEMHVGGIDSKDSSRGGGGASRRGGEQRRGGASRKRGRGPAAIERVMRKIARQH